ncbi:MAG: efflux RND transporter periplasmic adaptor subunit, partial [bacterium]
ITLDAFPDTLQMGRVRRVAPYVLDLEKQARTVDVEVDFVNPENARGFLPGYSADVEIVLERREGVLRVPTEALLEGHKLLVYRDGEVKEQAVEAGLGNWQFTEVLSGANAGDMAILSIDRDGVEGGAAVVPETNTEKP